MNWGPRSEVKWAGTPKREIQWVMRASAQSEAEVEAMGMASGHLVERSTMVKRYSAPAEGGKGPTRSTWRWLNLLAGTGMTWTGVFEMAGYLDSLAIKAGPGPGQGVRGHGRPEKSSGDQSLGGAAAGMGEAVHGVENLAAEVTGNEDPGVTQRHITQQTLGSNLLDLELRVRGQRLHLVT